MSSNKQLFLNWAQRMGNPKSNSEVVKEMVDKYPQVNTLNRYMVDVKTIFIDNFAEVDKRWLKKYGALKAKYKEPRPTIFDTIDNILTEASHKRIDQMWRQLRGKSQELIVQADGHLIDDLISLGSPWGKQLQKFERPGYIVTEQRRQASQSLADKMEGGMLNLDGKLQILYDNFVLKLMDEDDWRANCIAFLAATGLRSADCLFATFEESQYPYYIKLIRYVKNKSLLKNPVEKPVLLPYNILRELQDNLQQRIVADSKTIDFNSPTLINSRISAKLNNYIKKYVQNSPQSIQDVFAGKDITVHRLREIFLATALATFKSDRSLIDSAKRIMNHSGNEIGELAHYLGKKFNDQPIKLLGLKPGTILNLY